MLRFNKIKAIRMKYALKYRISQKNIQSLNNI